MYIFHVSIMILCYHNLIIIYSIFDHRVCQALVAKALVLSCYIFFPRSRRYILYVYVVCCTTNTMDTHTCLLLLLTIINRDTYS